MKSESPPSPLALTEESSSAPGASEAPSGRESAPGLATLDFALLRGALEEIPFGVATTRGGTILYANEALTRIYGAPPGGLENMAVSQLFTGDTYARITQRLVEARVFDGRVATRGVDGRAIDAEVHIEWYSSEAQGVGGFLVVRDVSLELGALGRLVDHLGGALFRFRIADHTLEMMSPAIVTLTGIDAATCIQHPVLLTTLVSVDERERALFLYRRMLRGEVPVAVTQVNLKRPDGTVRLLQIRATCSRDTSGVVRHVDGVVSDTDGGAHGKHQAAVDGLASLMAPRREASTAPEPLASAAMELSHELLREGSQLLHTLGRELRGLRAGLKASAGSPPRGSVEDLFPRVDAAATALASANALNRGVRRMLTAATSLGAPLAELLENVRVMLTSVMGAGERALVVDAGDAANVVIPERVEELSGALVYLALRAFRFAGSGTLHIMARRTEPPAAPPRARARGPLASAGRTHVAIEILASAPADMADTAVEVSSDVLRTVPRPAETDIAYQAAQRLIAAAGGAIESDDAAFSTARSVIRLCV